MSPSLTRNGAIFSIGRNDGVALPHFLSLVSADSYSHQLIQALFDLCDDDPESLADMSLVMMRMSWSRSYVIKHCNELIKKQILTKSTIQLNDKKRSRTFYCLNDVKEIAVPEKEGGEQQALNLQDQGNRLDEDQRKKIIKSVENALTLDADQFLRYPGVSPLDYVFKGELFIIFCLIPALRMSTSGKNTAGDFDVRVNMGKEWFDLRVRGQYGSLNAGVTDLRILIALFSLIDEKIRYNESVHNPFIVGLDDLCEALGYEKEGGNKRQIMAMLERWEGTGFKIINMTPVLLEKYDGELVVDKLFRVITSITSLSTRDRKSKVKTPELLQINLDPFVFSRLQEFNRKIRVHSEILTERKPSPFAHAFYYWCRRVVQHSATPKTFTLDHLHREISPQTSWARFKKNMNNLVSDRWDTDLKYSKYTGYCFRLINGTLRIWADKNDPIIGEKSYRNYRLKAKQAKQITN